MRKLLPIITLTLLTACGNPSPQDFSNSSVIRYAQDYVSSLGISEQRLREQLSFEGFSDAEINYALSSLTIDYDIEATQKAHSYIAAMPISKHDLEKQLLFEGFSQESVDYALQTIY